MSDFSRMGFPPKIVRACGVPKSKEIRLRLGEEIWDEAVETGDVDRIGQYIGLVTTGLPDLPGNRGLLAAHSLWQGFERPANKKADAPNYYGYIACPPATYAWNDEIGGILPGIPPSNCVFMVSVWMPPPDSAEIACWSDQAGEQISGEIQDWEWVLADLKEVTQPSGPKRRFRHRHW